MSTRVYAYDARLPIENAALVEQQLRLGHIFQETLTRVEHDRRNAIEAHYYAAIRAETDAWAAARMAYATAAEAVHMNRSTKGDILEPDLEMKAEKKEETNLAKAQLEEARATMRAAYQAWKTARRTTTPLIRPLLRQLDTERTEMNKRVYAAVGDLDNCNIGAAISNFMAGLRGWDPVFHGEFTSTPNWNTRGKIMESVERAAKAAQKEGFEVNMRDGRVRLDPVLPKIHKYEKTGKIAVQLKGKWLTGTEIAAVSRTTDNCKRRSTIRHGGRERAVEMDGTNAVILNRWGERSEEIVSGVPVFDQWLVFQRSAELAADTRFQIASKNHAQWLELQGRQLGSSRLGLVRNGPRKGQERIFPTTVRTRETPRFGDAAGEAKYAVARLRLGANDGVSVWAAWPIVLHRALPPNGSVKWAEMHAMRIGPRIEWQLLVTVEESDVEKQELGPTLAINLGWRNLPGTNGEVRVAYVVGSDGFEEEVLVPAECARVLEHVNGIEATRKKNFNLAVATLGQCLDDDHYVWPDTLRIKAQYRDRWLAPKKLVFFLGAWSRNRFEGDEAIFEILSAWKKQDRHLWFWCGDERAKMQRMRQDFYRAKAASWSAYRRFVVTDMDLRDFAGLPAPEEGAKTVNKVQRKTQKLAAPSIFRAGLKNFASRCGKEYEECTREIEVDGKTLKGSPRLTDICNICQALTPFNRRPQLRHTCFECRSEWDQDANHARNLLRFDVARVAVVSNPAEALEAGDIQGDSGQPTGSTATGGGRFQRRRSQGRAQRVENADHSE